MHEASGIRWRHAEATLLAIPFEEVLKNSKRVARFVRTRGPVIAEDAKGNAVGILVSPSMRAQRDDRDQFFEYSGQDGGSVLIKSINQAGVDYLRDLLGEVLGQYEQDAQNMNYVVDPEYPDVAIAQRVFDGTPEQWRADFQRDLDAAAKRLAGKRDDAPSDDDLGL